MLEILPLPAPDRNSADPVPVTVPVLIRFSVPASDKIWLPLGMKPPLAVPRVSKPP